MVYTYFCPMGKYRSPASSSSALASNPAQPWSNSDQPILPSRAQCTQKHRIELSSAAACRCSISGPTGQPKYLASVRVHRTQAKPLCMCGCSLAGLACQRLGKKQINDAVSFRRTASAILLPPYVPRRPWFSVRAKRRRQPLGCLRAHDTGPPPQAASQVRTATNRAAPRESKPRSDPSRRNNLAATQTRLDPAAPRPTSQRAPSRTARPRRDSPTLSSRSFPRAAA